MMQVGNLAWPSLNAHRTRIYGKNSRITLWTFDLRLGSPNFQPWQVSLRPSPRVRLLCMDIMMECSLCLHRWANRSKSWFKRLVAMAAASHILGNIMCTTVFLFVSHQNYPGGLAMQRLHQLEKPYIGKTHRINLPRSHIAEKPT